MTEEERRSEAEKPLTREDVLKLIEQHGGPEGLDLSGRNLEGIDLSAKYSSLINLQRTNLQEANLQYANLQEANLQEANLQEANLHYANLQYANLQEANLQYANLKEAKLCYANLQKARLSTAELQEADLYYADLQKAVLQGTNLQKAILESANLQDAVLEGAKLQDANLFDVNLHRTNLQFANLANALLGLAKITSDTRLDSTNWGPNYIIGDEKREIFSTSENVYRTLKQWYTQAGMYTIADQFHYREWAVARKGIRWREHFWQKLWNWVFCILCGYGGRPERVIFWAAVIILVLAGIYSFSTLSLLDSLYHSAVSFTALGYGLGASTPVGWIKGLGAFEAFIGVFMMSLFLITFVRKMVR